MAAILAALVRESALPSQPTPPAHFIAGRPPAAREAGSASAVLGQRATAPPSLVRSPCTLVQPPCSVMPEINRLSPTGNSAYPSPDSSRAARFAMRSCCPRSRRELCISSVRRTSSSWKSGRSPCSRSRPTSGWSTMTVVRISGLAPARADDCILTIRGPCVHRP